MPAKNYSKTALNALKRIRILTQLQRGGSVLYRRMNKIDLNDTEDTISEPKESPDDYDKNHDPSLPTLKHILIINAENIDNFTKEKLSATMMEKYEETRFRIKSVDDYFMVYHLI